jgi:histidine triad (HIT) family protein
LRIQDSDEGQNWPAKDNSDKVISYSSRAILLMECLFCNIVSGKIPALIVAEDERHMAFLDINPSSTGHTVVIPKKHYSKIEEMPKAEAGALFGFISELSSSVMKAVGTENCNIGLNNGKVAGQEIPHVHVHIIPRFPGDGGVSIQQIVKMPFNKEDLPKVAGAIKGAISVGCNSGCSCEARKEPEIKKEPEKKPEAAPQPKPEAKPEEKPKPKQAKSIDRQMQEFKDKEQDYIEDLTEARNA